MYWEWALDWVKGDCILSKLSFTYALEMMEWMIVPMYINTILIFLSTQYIHQYLTIPGIDEILFPIPIPIPNFNTTQHHGEISRRNWAPNFPQHQNILVNIVVWYSWIEERKCCPAQRVQTLSLLSWKISRNRPIHWIQSNFPSVYLFIFSAWNI